MVIRDASSVAAGLVACGGMVNACGCLGNGATELNVVGLNFKYAELH